ncbi:MAG: hypothetical protein FWE08_03735 [Oscillospiraceae bacterium]|nr:hypothetical protein [Oscillospiraceae bacterium]
MEKGPMSKRRLEQYKSLQSEIAMLGEQILSATASDGVVTDMVRGSAAEHPYTSQNIVIQGHGSPRVSRLAARRREHEAECAAVEEYVEAVEDSVIRQILTWRYLLGESVEETSRMVGYSKSQVDRKLKNFFEKMRHYAPL